MVLLSRLLSIAAAAAGTVVAPVRGNARNVLGMGADKDEMGRRGAESIVGRD